MVNLIASTPNKQSSLDPLPAKYLKIVSGDVACLLAHIFNYSFENGYMPSKFKQHDIPVGKVRVEDCTTKVKQGLASNRLLLKPSKTEAMWCTTSRRYSSFNQPSLVVDQVVIKPSLSIRDLAVQLRADLSVADHVFAVIRSGYYNIHQLRSSR